jgi:HAD superfamily hydrolase (TIGR01549 family)
MKVLFWDFDGTLIDTRQKNYNVTQKIVHHVTGNDPQQYNFIKSFENYKKGIAQISNWRAIYQQYFQFNDELTDQVGHMWTEFQLNDTTPTPLFCGIEKVLSTYSELPMAIVSQNAKASILQQLDENNILDHFNYIIGFEEIDIRKQKPEPDGLLMCLEKLEITNGSTVFYIGDHETDVLLAGNTNKVLRSQNSSTQIVSIGAFYGNDQKITEWRIKPDYHVNQAADIIEVIGRYDKKF